MRPSRSSSTCAAVVGLGRPKELALGAAIGMPAAEISARATGCAGTRTPTSGRPAVTTSGTSGPRGSSSVSGPGQKASISARAVSLTSATSRPSGNLAHVHNHRIPRRPLLGREDALHRLRIEGIRAQPINRLGGKRHRAATAPDRGNALDGGCGCLVL